MQRGSRTQGTALCAGAHMFRVCVGYVDIRGRGRLSNRSKARDDDKCRCGRGLEDEGTQGLSMLAWRTASLLFRKLLVLY